MMSKHSVRAATFAAAAVGAVAALAVAGAAGSQQMPTPLHDYKAAPAGKPSCSSLSLDNRPSVAL